MLRKSILLLLILFPWAFARADFIFAPGLQALSADQSEEENAIGKSHLNLGGGGGFLADLEFLAGPLGLNIELGWTGHGNSKAQYNNTNTGVAANDLKASGTLLTGFVGPRLRIINLKRFKTFIGGGLLTGLLFITYDEKDFDKKVGNTDGFKDSESRSLSGHYLEAGFEAILTNKSAFRLAGKSISYETKSFETLGDNKLSFQQFSVAVQYMHYVDWSFFWK